MIKLRAVEPSDASQLLLWENNPENWAISNTQIPFSLASINLFIEAQENDIYISKQVRFIIENEAEMVGCIDLFDFDPKNLRAGVGILIEKAHRQKNYAFQALLELEKIARNTLFLNQLFAFIEIENEGSIALFQKSGFVQCGLLKSWQRTINGWKDVGVFQKILTKA
jgi:diamine N-acetyltransferase